MIIRIMANAEYCISSPSYNNDASSRISDSTISSSATLDDNTLCHCQQRAAATNNCSPRQRNRQRSNMPINNPVFLSMIMLVIVSCFTCCVSAWPILNHRRTYNYAPPAPVVIPDYNDLVDINQWAVAAQPDYYDPLPAIPLQKQQLDQDLFDDAEIDDQEPEDDVYQMPYFGPIVDSVEPEEELELEELKYQQPYMYEKRRPAKVTPTVKPPVDVASASSSHPKTTPASASPSPSSTASSMKLQAGQQKHLAAPQPLKISSSSDGQKEIAMLRPPSSKSHHIQLDEPEEPKISVAQRSPSNEKPSAYDRLRKYLSLDDALKKEYQQRRANAMNRHHTKRESIITDSDSLTGQLNNLKKKLD